MKKTFKLPRKLTEKWLEDLKSGEFTQTRGILYNDNKGYCCLGVLCNQFIDLGELEEKDLTQNGSPEDVIGLHKFGIPEELYSINNEKYNLAWILTRLNDGITLLNYTQFKKKYPNLEFKHIPIGGSDLNDVRYSFIEIAEFIETNTELID